jgi:tungstate transport system substrate-binding protein
MLKYAFAALLIATPATAESIIVQSTTSTANSGLYAHLLPIFEAETGITARIVAVGTGQAIRNARNCDGDVLLVHAKAAEEQFVADGRGVARFDVMYNDFVLVGPAEDPSKVKGMAVGDALTKIADDKALFASRGDDSGTHKKERALWETTDTDPSDASGTWYRETGSGMGATLNVAVGMGAYTMTDRATWIAFGNKADFEVVVEGDNTLYNQYGVILINPEVCPDAKADAGQSFIDWLLSEAGQTAIATYSRDGQQLFFPNATGSGENG